MGPWTPSVKSFKLCYATTAIVQHILIRVESEYLKGGEYLSWCLSVIHHQLGASSCFPFCTCACRTKKVI